MVTPPGETRSCRPRTRPGRRLGGEPRRAPSPDAGVKAPPVGGTPARRGEFVVDRLLNFIENDVPGKWEHRVRSYGYPVRDSTWEPTSHIPRYFITAFCRKHKLPIPGDNTVTTKMRYEFSKLLRDNYKYNWTSLPKHEYNHSILHHIHYTYISLHTIMI